MDVRHGRKLGQMGDAEHLLGAGHARQLLRHLLGCPAGHTGVHLVKDQGAHVVILCQHILEGQHDAGQLTAGGDLLDGLQILPYIGGHKELHLVQSGFVHGVLPCFGPELHLEPHFRHVQLGQFGLNTLLQRLGRFTARPAQRLTPPPDLLHRFAQIPFQPGNGIAGELNLVQLLSAPLQVVQHLLHGVPVLLFQPVDHIQTTLQLVQLTGFKVETIP